MLQERKPIGQKGLWLSGLALVLAACGREEVNLELTPSVSRRSSSRSIDVSVSCLGCVYQSPVNGATSARRASRSSPATSNERPPCRYTAPSWVVVKARATSTVPSSSPEEVRRS